MPKAGFCTRGSISPLLAVVVCVVVSCCVAVVNVGGRVIAGARVQAAADSVALAVVMRDRVTADRVAQMLNVRIVSVRDDGVTVSVVTRTGGITRSATAQRAVVAGDASDG